jgi:hypothetical protein
MNNNVNIIIKNKNDVSSTTTSFSSSSMKQRLCNDSVRCPCWFTTVVAFLTVGVSNISTISTINSAQLYLMKAEAMSASMKDLDADVNPIIIAPLQLQELTHFEGMALPSSQAPQPNRCFKNSNIKQKET